MDAGQVALAAFGRLQTGGAADAHRLGREAASVQFAEQVIQPRAMATDDDEVGGLQFRREKVDVNAAIALDVLGLPADDDKAVSLAKRCHRPGAFAQRIGGPRLLAAVAGDEADEQVFGTASLRVNANGQPRRHDGGASFGEASHLPQHRGEELVKGEDGRRGKAGQHGDGQRPTADAIDGGETERLARLQSDAMSDDAGRARAGRRRGRTHRRRLWRCRH